jgi:hypothetical protein
MLFSVLSKNLVVAVFILFFSKLSPILTSSFGHVPMAHLDGSTCQISQVGNQSCSGEGVFQSALCGLFEIPLSN